MTSEKSVIASDTVMIKKYSKDTINNNTLGMSQSNIFYYSSSLPLTLPAPLPPLSCPYFIELETS